MGFYSLLRSLANFLCMVGLLGCIWVTSASTSAAAFILSNLAANDSLNTAGSLAGFEASGAISVGFKVLAPTTLNSVELRLRANTGSSATKDATLVLRDDNAGSPGTKLADFNTVAVVGTSFQTANFNPTTNVVLTSGSTYWLTLGTTIQGGGDGLVAGSRNPAVNPSGTDGEFVGLRFGAPDTQISSPLFTDAPSIQIQGITAVPEPTTLGLAGLGTVVLLRRIRKLRRSAI